MKDVVSIADSELSRKREAQAFMDNAFIKSALPLAFSITDWHDKSGNKIIPTIDTRIEAAWEIAEKSQKKRRLVK